MDDDAAASGKPRGRNVDRITGAILFVFGLYTLHEVWGWEFMNADGPGPGFFPWYFGLGITIFAAALFVSTYLRRDPDSLAALIDTTGVEDVVANDTEGSWRAPAMTFAGFAVCVALMPLLGFIVAYALFVIFMMMFVFGRSLMLSVVSAVAITAGFELIFPWALRAPLPTGIWGF